MNTKDLCEHRPFAGPVGRPLADDGLADDDGGRKAQLAHAFAVARPTVEEARVLASIVPSGMFTGLISVPLT